MSVTDTTEHGQTTGTKDANYDLLWFTQACLDNALRLDQYVADAEDTGDDQLADLFRRARADSRKGAEQGKDLLRERLGSDA